MMATQTATTWQTWENRWYPGKQEAAYRDERPCEMAGGGRGIYAEVWYTEHAAFNWNGKHYPARAFWHFDGQAYACDPRHTGKQYNRIGSYPTFEQAMEAARAYVAEAEQFIAAMHGF